MPQEIFKASSYLLNLINDIMELSRIQAGEMSVSIEKFDLASVITEIGSVSRQLAAEHNVEFFNAHDTVQGVELTADRTRVKQVLMNLITNGLKYNKSGGEVRINVSLPRRETVRISVSDTGLGLSEEQIKSIFNPFERLGLERSEIDGTGIGLTITKEMVGLMNGKLGIESTPGEGSTFWVELPGTRVTQPAPRLQATEESDSGIDDTFASLSPILVAEDNHRNQVLIRQQLALWGIEAVICNDGEIAYEEKQKNEYSVLVTDLHMPNLGGFDLMERIRADEIAGAKRTYIVALSADASRDEQERCLAAGMGRLFD